MAARRAFASASRNSAIFSGLTPRSASIFTISAARSSSRATDARIARLITSSCEERADPRSPIDSPVTFACLVASASARIRLRATPDSLVFDSLLDSRPEAVRERFRDILHKRASIDPKPKHAAVEDSFSRVADFPPTSPKSVGQSHQGGDHSIRQF